MEISIATFSVIFGVVRISHISHLSFSPFAAVSLLGVAGLAETSPSFSVSGPFLLDFPRFQVPSDCIVPSQLRSSPRALPLHLHFHNCSDAYHTCMYKINQSITYRVSVVNQSITYRVSVFNQSITYRVSVSQYVSQYPDASDETDPQDVRHRSPG